MQWQHITKGRLVRYGAGILALILIIIAAAMLPGLWLKNTPITVPIKLNDREYEVTVPQNEAERIQGLSGTESLAPDKGMLFVFEREGNWGIWMKDMNYPIDIIWLDDDKRVVHMVENASPESYPETTFRPERPARYVVELAAGGIADASVSIGDQATFSVAMEDGGRL